jgi:putative ABC transport system permease protein
LRSAPFWDLDSWQEVGATLGRNRLRTALTACGVFWGMLMLTLFLGFGNGLEHGVNRDFMGLLRQTMWLRSDRTLIAYDGLAPGRLVRLTNDDMEFARRFPGVQLVSPRLSFGTGNEGQNVEAGLKTGNFFVQAATPEFALIEPVELTSGRHLDPTDMTEERKVAIVGRNVRRILFNREDPVGRYVSFKSVFFQVVGEVRSLRTGQQGDRMDNTVFIPLGTAQRAFNRRGFVDWAGVALASDAPALDVERELVAALRKRHRVHPDDQQGIRSWNVAAEFRRIAGLFLGIRLFVWFVGMATLFAGILGVSNILLITVKERTKEIGIRKALGATRGSILWMIISESLVLTSVAGYAGIVAGVGLLELAGRLTAQVPQAPVSEPEVDLAVVLLGGAILLAGGLLAAVMPARRATRIQPVEALRAE